MNDPTTRTIILLRHGWSAADDENVHEGRYDSPLTDKGRAQVARLAARWLNEGRQFDRVVCSPLRRAGETARLLGGALGFEPHPSELWLEHDNSPVAGQPLDEVRRRFPHAEEATPFTHPFGSRSETPAAMHRRAGAALEEALSFAGERLLVVAHGGILNAAIRNIVGAPPPSGGVGLWFSFGDTGFTTVQYHANHSWRVLGVNDQQHLT